jgi:hypothetical protein
VLKFHLRKTSRGLELSVEVRRATLMAVLGVVIYLLNPEVSMAVGGAVARSAGSCLQQLIEGRYGVSCVSGQLPAGASRLPVGAGR